MSAPIIVGYDGTEGAQAALAEALRLAGALDAELVLAFARTLNPAGGEVADMAAQRSTSAAWRSLDEAIEPRACGRRDRARRDRARARRPRRSPRSPRAKARS